MDGFKRIMRNGDLDQVWNLYSGMMQKFLQIAHQFRYFCVIRWYKSGIRRPAATDQVLTFTEFPRELPFTAYTFKEDFMGIVEW